MHRIIPWTVSGAAVALLLAFGASPVSSQTTFTACRVPSVGAIYMIGVASAPGACLDGSHVEFSWTEGGVPPDGSVTTAKLADGAVTQAKLDAGITIGGSAWAGFETVFASNFIQVPPGEYGFVAATATCPAGKVPISGGYSAGAWNGNFDQFYVKTNQPAFGTSWIGETSARNITTTTQNFSVSASVNCVNAT